MDCVLEKTDLTGLCLENNCCYYYRALKLCTYIALSQRGHGRNERLNASELITEPAKVIKKKAIKKKRISKRVKVK